MDELVKNIRKHYIIDVLRSIVPTVLLNGVAIGMFYSVLHNDLAGDLLFLAFLCGLVSVFCLVLFIKNLILAINPFKSDVFKKYGNPEKVASIYREIASTTEYEDNTMVISRNYICHKSRAEILVACNDVLAVHKLVHKTNFVVDCYQIVITDKYGETLHFTYKKNEESLVDTLLVRIKGKCQNAKAGYTQDALDHIRNNKVPLNSNAQTTPFVATFKNGTTKRRLLEIDNANSPSDCTYAAGQRNPTLDVGNTFFCTKCGEKLIASSSFCTKCGTKIETVSNAPQPLSLIDVESAVSIYLNQRVSVSDISCTLVYVIPASTGTPKEMHLSMTVGEKDFSSLDLIFFDKNRKSYYLRGNRLTLDDSWQPKDNIFSFDISLFKSFNTEVDRDD